MDAAPAPRAPAKSEGGKKFKLVSDYAPAGDQPTAIAELSEGIVRGEGDQTLLGVTGSGKTFTMAKVIEETQRPALILAHNKTLAAQLYSEFKSFFPDNAVEYFVSYYDYQPEAYVPRTDTYIEKDSSINEQIDRMRHSATRAILERDDVIVVASVSCIYGIGSVETYTAMTFTLAVGDRVDEKKLLADLVAQQYKRNDQAFERGSFRKRGDVLEIFPAHYEDRAWRVSFFGDEVGGGGGGGGGVDPGIRPAHRQEDHRAAADQDLRQQPLCDAAPDAEAGDHLDQGRAARAPRLDGGQRQAAGSPAAGAAHQLRHRDAGDHRLLRRHRELQPLPDRPPPRRAAADLLRIHPDNALLFVDESHQTIPQIGAMYKGDRNRKFTLAEYGFRLPRRWITAR